MGNILKKPMESIPPEDCNGVTVLNDCELCHLQFSSSLKFTHNCSHTICKRCISNHIKSKLKINTIEITCPAPDCKMILDPVLCRGIVRNEPYMQWLDRLCYNSIVERRKCYCPHRECRALIIDECNGPRSFATKSKCPQCKNWICFSCKTLWHQDEACDASKRREIISLNDILFMGMVMREEKILACCPTCNMYSELVPNVGHSIVRCRCKTVYCFHCEKKVKRLRCNCNEFMMDVGNYNCSLLVKSALVLVLIAAALLNHANNIMDEYY